MHRIESHTEGSKISWAPREDWYFMTERGLCRVMFDTVVEYKELQS